MPRACPERSRRGSPRPGSGPPIGNLNALKHGHTSRRYKRLLQLIAQDPEASDLILQIARAQRRRRERAEREASHLLTDFTQRLRQRARDDALALYENDQTIPPTSDTHQPSISAPTRKTTKHPT